jgi:FkbM family methyltransferase
MKLNSTALSKWRADKGDYTHNITYDLNEKSIIMDLGGYTGVWAQQMIDKYNPNVYIIEPVPQFYTAAKNKFIKNNKVRLMCVGVSQDKKEGIIYLSRDGSSANQKNGNPVKVKLKNMENILYEFKLEYVDLLQINIEGDEYSLLEDMIKTGFINKFKNIQVQFHLGVDNDINRREKIREGLIENNFKIKFDYPFVWESWTKNAIL